MFPSPCPCPHPDLCSASTLLSFSITNSIPDDAMASMASMASSRGSPGQWSPRSSTGGTPRDGTPDVNLDSSTLGHDSAHATKRKSRASTAAAGGVAAGGGSFPVVGKIRHLKRRMASPYGDEIFSTTFYAPSSMTRRRSSPTATSPVPRRSRALRICT